MNLKKENLRQILIYLYKQGSILLSKFLKEFRFFYLIHIKKDKSCKKIYSGWYIKSIVSTEPIKIKSRRRRVGAPTEASENLDWKEKYFDLQKQFIALQKRFFILEKQFRQSLVKLGISRIIAVTLCIGLIVTNSVQYFPHFSKAATYNWTVTSKANWEAGTITKLDTTTSEGDIKLSDAAFSSVWSSLTAITGATGAGGSSVRVGNYIYALRGGSRTDFYRYDISGNSWSAMTSVTAAIGAGGALTYDGTYIYALRGGSTTDFYRYDISGNSWSAMTSVLGTVGTGGSLTYDGTYIYALRGGGTADFYRYDISENFWTGSAGFYYKTTLQSNPAQNLAPLLDSIAINYNSGSSVSDSFTDETKVASKSNTVIDAGNGQIKLDTSAVTIDYMEYSSNSLAQAAYVTNATYGNTGGTITTNGNYTVHKFTSSGTFTSTKAANVATLVVAGGGGGGQGMSGGGGGGGLIYDANFAITAQAYPITVGAGGVKGPTGGNSAGGNGENSVFSTKTAIGGGGGGGASTWGLPKSGGSGGGGQEGNYQLVPGGAGTSGQGNNGGGSSDLYYANPFTGGGGGGAGAVGSTSRSEGGTSGGGVGLAYDIVLSGTNVYYAGGGGGGGYGTAYSNNPGLGGNGGGGNGTCNDTVAQSGTPNTGGGGGGGAYSGGAAGAGGSGIVVIRCLTSDFLSLQSSSESTIKSQGTYALKGSAAITGSLNKTLTRTISPTIDLTDKSLIYFDIRSTRTGSNIKISMHDSGGTTTEITPNITSANVFQTVSWDISAVSNANKDAIDSMVITIVNADADNTFYIDNMYSPYYYSSGTLTSTNLLSGLKGSVDSFDYNASSIPADSVLKLQFSPDNTNWYNSSGTLNDYNTLSSGSNSISLSSLGWEVLAQPSAVIGAGGAMVRAGNYIYALRGGSSTDFYRYDISGNSWSAMTSITGAVGAGGSLIYDGTNIYALRGGNTSNFYKYNISGNSWSTLSSTSVAINDGGALAYDGTNIYALHGGTTDFYYYPLLYFGNITNLKKDAGGDAGWNTISWNATVPSGTLVKFRTRTAATEGGLSGASWSDWYTSSPADITSGINRWCEAEAYLESTIDGTSPTINDFTVSYSINASPELQTLTASQGADGLVNISYQVRDTDTNDGEEAHQGKATISFQYWDGDEWQEATTTTGEGVKNVATSPATDWTTYTGTWDPKTDYNNQYTANGMKIKVTANDLELVYNTATLESSTFELDTINPASPSIKVNASTQYGSNAATLTLSATDSTMQSGVKGSMMISLDSGFSGASYQTYNTASTITLADNPDTVYVKFKDAKGNVSATASVITPATPACIMTQDTSNVRITPNEYRLFIAWEVIDDPPQGIFDHYSILRSNTTNDADFTEVGTVNVKTTNYYTDTTPDYNVLHYYKIIAYDSLNNISYRSNAITGKANGIQDSGEGGGGTDITAPTVSNVTSTDVYTSQATITWTTDEFSDSTVGYSTSEVLETFTYVNLPTMGTSHSLTINGLTQDTPYYFLVKSEDPSNNETVDNHSNAYYTFTTLPGPTLTNVSVSQINNSTAKITWLTDTSSNSYVVYSTSSDLSGSLTHGTETRVLTPNSEDYYEHSVEISSLTPGTRYYFYVKSYDISINLGINDNASDYYFFNTTYDLTPPIINEVSASTTAYTSTITWETDELATSQVEYGLTDGYGTLSPSSVTTTDLTIDHVIKLSSLTVGSTYHFRVYSKDANNNESVSADYTFTPTREGDLTGPTISTPEVPSASIFTNQATITWTTDELSDSTVEYSATPGVYSLSKNSTSMVTSHSVVLTGLSKNTPYYFRVKSKDAAENETTKSNDYSFITKAGSIISNVIISSVVNEKVTVRWLTDTASDSKVVYSTTSNLSNPQQETDETLNTVHVINLTGLYPNVIYYFYVESTDVSENTAKDNNQGSYYYFTTADDQVDPVISLVNSSATAYTSTITWETDELSTSQLEYGTTTDYGTETDLDSQLTIQHVIHLTDLTTDRTYHFRVKSKDANDNESVSGDYNFITTQEAEPVDATAPVISEVNSYATETIGTITWTTDDLATSQIEYGSTTAYGTSTTLNSTLTVEHVVRLTDLISEQVYHYRIKSKNSADLETVSQDYTLTPQYVSQEVRVINAGGGGSSATLIDKTTPIISNILTSNITENSATISWVTNENANSLIDYGLTSTYTDTQHAGLSSFVTSHQAILSGLTKATVYHYQVLSQDASGNLAQGADLIFTTLGSSVIPPVPEITENEEITEPEAEKTPEEKAQEIKKIEEQTVSQETFTTAMEMIKKVSSTISLSVAENGFTELANIFKGFIPGPILEGSPGIEISATEARVKWTTDRKANSVVAITKVADFDKTKSEPYSQVVGQSSEYELAHNVNIINLVPSTDYYFQIRSKSIIGSETRSKQYTFTTASQLPEVTNFSIKNISERAATFVWQTNIPTDSQVKYIPYRNNKLSPNEVQVVSKSDSSITHEITVKNLEPGTTFNVSLEGKDLQGNNYSFLIPNFTTTKDKNAPIISQIRTSIALSSRGDEVQTIITWNTNEVSTSQVEYQVGFANDTPIIQMAKDISLRQEHLMVITSFKPGSIYRFRVISEDSSGNKTQSTTNTLLTPQRRLTVTELIFKNFQQTFGWMKGLGK
ncbi:MAG: fibronectin type III domain-containing protein [Patescibacteria group bacterium]|nr:fibronectin type III domain-containing protein [Patescibacteria group bacterium]